MPDLHHITANLKTDPNTRVEEFEGSPHLVVPVVMIVDGVLNDALVTHEEYGKYVESWNGRPVPVLHPEENGSPISANRPDVMASRSIGFVFNAKVTDNKLKAELWLNINKAERLQFSDIIENLKAGKVMEVSTGYFSDGEAKPGKFNGMAYSVIHRNIRPDHLALLPGETGACSVEDGCGTRVNAKQNQSLFTGAQLKKAIVDAIENMTAKTARFMANDCNCKHEENAMPADVLKDAEKLKANGKLTPEQFEMLQGMDPEQLAMVGALTSALGSGAAAAPEPMEEDEPEMMNGDEDKPVAMSEKKIEELVTMRVADTIERIEVMRELKANEACDFSEDELKAMNVNSLKKLAAALRPKDFSGAGAFATNSNEVGTQCQPLTVHRGVLAKQKKEA